MKGKSVFDRRVLVATAVAVVIIALGVGLGIWRSQLASVILRGTVVDELTGEAVYGVQVSVGEQTTTRHVSTQYRLTNITPGDYVVYARAPGYEPLEEEVSLKRGTNTLDVVLRGDYVPGLERIYVFSVTRPEGIELEIRFANENDRSILHYPGLELVFRGILHTEGQAANSRARILYDGPIEVLWDSSADPWKYRGYLAWSEIAPRQEDEKLGVFDVVLSIPGQGDYSTVVSGVRLRAP